MTREEIQDALYDLVEAGYIAGRRGFKRLEAERIAVELSETVLDQISPEPASRRRKPVPPHLRGAHVLEERQGGHRAQDS
jgi:hypothetical protein